MPYPDSGTGNVTFTGTNGPWTIWVQSAITTSATSTVIWQAWAGNYGPSMTNTATTTGGIIWHNWNEVIATHGHRIVQDHDYAAACGRIVTPEERARRDAETAALQAKYEEEKRFRIAAEAKAELLLQRLLTDEQRESLKEKRCFYLHSKGRKYRVDRGQHGNVKLLDEKDKIIESYCIQPKGGLPDADAMAAQKLLLETDPEMFARVANITRHQPHHPLAAVGR